MTPFGLDDVREAYTSDVTRFLSEVETSAKAVLASAGLAVPAERTWQPPVAAIVAGLHGIVGSSSLIGLASMTTTARRLEDLAQSANESIRMLTWHAARLRRITAACLDGAADLQAILGHELAGAASAARDRSAALHGRLDATIAGLEAGPQLESVAADQARPSTRPIPTPLGKLPPVPAPHRGHADRLAAPSPPAAAATTDDGWELGGAVPAHEVSALRPVDDELAATFREEAEAALTSLRGYRARLERDDGDRDAAIHCARLLHLLKGAAALTGRDEVAERAGALHDWLETVTRQGVTAAAVRELGGRLDELATLAVGAPPPVAPVSAAAAPVSVTATPDGPDADDEPRQIFVAEARQALDELAALVRAVGATTGTARGVAASRTERLLHRLKGSALIVDEPQVAEVASRGQALCDALERVDPVALEAVALELAALLGPPTSAPSSVAAPSATPFVLPAAEEWDAYLEESGALLDDLDRALTKLEQSTRPTAELSAMFRLYHTLKGASSSVGLAPIARQLHLIEAFLERIVAAPTLPELRPVVSALAGEHAAVRAAVARASAHATLEVDLERTTARLAAIGERGAASVGSWIAASDPVWATSVADGADSRAPGAGSASQASHASHASPGSPSGAEVSREPSAADEQPDVGRRFVRVAADRLDGLLDLVGELVVARSRMLTRIARIHSLQDEDQHRHGTVIRLVDDFATSTEFANLDGGRGLVVGRSAARRGRAVGASRAAGGAGFGALELDHYEEIHVLSRQLDEAASDIDEMRRAVTTEMLQLSEDAETLSAIVTGLQTEITQARMLTVETLFTRLQLPIRDAAQRLGREVEIVTHGEQVAIDKAIADALFGPLLHVVRNAVVHGIEAPAQRAALGKPRAGTLTLAARQDQGQVVLEVSDDGQGIDTARLKAAGVAKGLIDPTTPEHDPRVLELVFVHGLSTSVEADDVAGRGVGGNVLRRAVDRLSGAIAIESRRGAGTVFRITLPLSMSITQAVVLRAAGITLAIPIAFAETILPRDGAVTVDTFGRHRVQVGGAMMPVHVCGQLFGAPAPALGGVLVVCAVGGERIAIQADEVVGQEEIVVKSLGSLLEGHPLFSGSTQRGDGELVLILDVPGVLAAETVEQRGAPADLPAGEPAPAEASVATSASAAPATTSAPAPAPRPAGIAVAELVPLPVGGRRVLFVDDSLSVRKVAERMLRTLGVEVVTAVDGQDALDKLRALEFSLVFTDLEMPRVHGYELIREMQYLPAYRAIPVVVISSRSGQKHIDQALGMGAREYLTKPFSPEILDAVLARLIKPEPAS